MTKQVMVRKSFSMTAMELKDLLREQYPDFFAGSLVDVDVIEHSEQKFILTVSKLDQETLDA